MKNFYIVLFAAIAIGLQAQDPLEELQIDQQSLHVGLNFVPEESRVLGRGHNRSESER